MVTALAAAATAAAAVLCALLVLLRTRSWRVALPVLLDLLLAAGLLRLSGAQAWPSLVGAAVVVALRHVVVQGLRANPSWSVRSPGPTAAEKTPSV
ncbi:hypothetical protein [Thalassiella azotivora]